MNLKFLFAALIWGSLCNTGWSQDIPLDSAVRTGKLANGFTYYIRHNTEPKKRVTFYLANKVGSILESDDQRGLAHFMEHMSFNGTSNFPKNELVNYLQKAGVRFGADLNAYTGFDETVYQLPIPSDDPEVLRHGLQIMRDWAQGASLDTSEIDKERGVVLEEKRLGKGAAERMQRLYFPVVLNNSLYANRMPIGTEEVLTGFKYESFRRFYHDWYRPDLQALIVVGDIDVDKIEREIVQRFSDLKNPKEEKIRTKYTIPLSGKNQFIVVTDPEMTTTVAQVIIKQPELTFFTAAQYRQSIIRDLFNTMISERYADVQRQAEPPYLQGSANISGFLGGLDSYTLSVTARPGALEKGFKAAWRVNEQVRRFGFTASELARAKTFYLNRLDAAYKEKDRTRSDNYVREYLQYFLNDIPSPGIAYEYNMAKGFLPGITAGDLSAYAVSVVKTSDRDIVIMAPAGDKESLPTEANFNGWIKTVQDEVLKPYQDDVNNEPLLVKQPVPGKIVNKKHDAKLNIITLTLSNGIRVLLKPTDFKNNEVLFSAFSAGGTSLYSNADFQSATYANLIASFGAGNYNNAALSKYLSGKQFNVSTSIGERAQGISGFSTVGDLEPALQMIYAYVTEPRKDSIIFKSILSRSKAGLVNRQNDPARVFSDTVAAVLGNYNVRRTGPSLQKLEQVDLDRAYTIYKERFADASGFTFVFTGSIDTVAIRPLLEKYVASLPALHKSEKARDLHIDIPPGKITKAVYKGTEPKATVNLVFSGTFDFSAENEIRMSALKELIQLRLTERLREEESGVYSPSVRSATVKYPQARYSFTISFGCAPQNAEKLISSAIDEINKVRNAGPSELNLDKYKSETLRGLENQLRSNGFWLGYISGQVQNNEQMGLVNNYETIIKNTTAADIKKMANRYLDGKNFITLMLLPEK